MVMTTTNHPTHADVERVMARYDEIVTGNRSADWDTFRAVEADIDGDVIFEVLDTATEMGFVRETDEDSDAWFDAIQPFLDDYKDLLRKRLADEHG
jgi:hypothetical protein